jgi:RNA polymerase sigma factor (sigma-70 family)
MLGDTDLGGPAAAFPATQCSLVRAAASSDPAVRRHAFDTLIAAYWKPVYKFIRVKWRLANEDAKDLTQAFFTRALEKGFFDRFDPDKARFRTFVRVCVDAFVANEQRAAGRAKRGGGVELLSLDFKAADGELCRTPVPAAADLDDFFHQEWVRALFSLAVEDLQRECAAADKHAHFDLFRRYDLEGPEALARVTYAQLAQEFGLPASQVTNFLAFARRRFRQLFLDRLRAATGDEEEFRQEARRLFAEDIP